MSKRIDSKWTKNGAHGRRNPNENQSGSRVLNKKIARPRPDSKKVENDRIGLGYDGKPSYRNSMSIQEKFKQRGTGLYFAIKKEPG